MYITSDPETLWIRLYPIENKCLVVKCNMSTGQYGKQVNK